MNKVKSRNISVIISSDPRSNKISACVESALKVSDDVILVGFTVDKSINELVKSDNVILHSGTYFNISEAKNSAAKAVKNDWILCIDSAEELSHELIRYLDNNNRLEDNKIYQIKRIKHVNDKPLNFGNFRADFVDCLYNRKTTKWIFKNNEDTLDTSNLITQKITSAYLKFYIYSSSADHALALKNTIKERVEKIKTTRSSNGLVSSLFRSWWSFVIVYFFKLGFLDGKTGFYLALNSSFLNTTYRSELKKQEHLKLAKTLVFMNTNKFWGGGEKWHFMAAKYFSEVLNYNIKVIVHPDGELRQKLESVGVSVIPFKVANLSFLNPIKIRRLGKIFNQTQSKAVILNGSEDLKLGGLAAYFYGAPNTYYRRGLAKAPKKNFLNQFLLTTAIDGIIANSQFTLKTLCSSNDISVKNLKSLVIGNPINSDKFSKNSSDTRVKNDKVIIGTASRIEDQKGYDLAVETAKKLRNHGLKFQWLWAGTGKKEDDFKNLIKESELQEYFHLIGFSKDVNAFLNKLDYYVCTSRYEGFGYSMAEAMLAKIPVLAFDSTSNPELVINGITGITVNSFDTSLLAEKIIYLAKNKDLQEELIESAFQFTKDKLRPSNIYEQLQNFIES